MAEDMPCSYLFQITMIKIKYKAIMALIGTISFRFIRQLRTLSTIRQVYMTPNKIISVFTLNLFKDKILKYSFNI